MLRGLISNIIKAIPVLAAVALVIWSNPFPREEEDRLREDCLCCRSDQSESESDRKHGTQALLATRFESLEEFMQVVQVEYYNGNEKVNQGNHAANAVKLIHCSGGRGVLSVLRTGPDEKTLAKAKAGNAWNKVVVGIREPLLIRQRRDLQEVVYLARRLPIVFGEGAVAFFDLALEMERHLYPLDLAMYTTRDTTEKGYINTFNHVTAQALLTTLYSEELADLVADVHERKNMPELISGRFTETQLTDVSNNPVDNYVDMINNEWGQELGKELRRKYSVTNKMVWSNHLLSNYLNDLQEHYSFAFGIGMRPFQSHDRVVERFVEKVNRVSSGKVD